MKFDINKTYPHPVLRPWSDDYIQSSFEAEIGFDRVEKSTEVRVSVDFTLSDDDLLGLVARKEAQYMLVVRCAKTFFRFAPKTFKNNLKRTFAAGQLAGLTEISPFLVATSHVSDFRAKDWNEDYKNYPPLELVPGTVLAIGEPEKYWVDTAEESPIGSIFELQAMVEQSDGQWHCNMQGHRIKICMSSNDYARFDVARSLDPSSGNYQAYIMNSVYLLALHHVLTMADTGEEEYGEYRWFRALNHRLGEMRLKELGAGDYDRLKDAQKVLENPFSKLPFMQPE